MQITSETLENNILKIDLSGRLDLQGSQEIDMKFTALTATSEQPVLVDMSKVSFLASLGIRTLLTAAKALSREGGKMVLFNPQETVMEVLDTSGVSSLIPIYFEWDSAIDTLVAHPK